MGDAKNGYRLRLTEREAEVLDALCADAVAREGEPSEQNFAPGHEEAIESLRAKLHRSVKEGL